MRKVLRKSCQRESFRHFFPLFSRKIFQKSGYRILLGIFGVACLISLYVKDLFLFAWMVLVFVIPFLLPSRLEEEIYNLNFGTLKHLGSTVFLVLFIIAGENAIVDGGLRYCAFSLFTRPLDSG